ncbi:hypothetical protein VTL71DRAFT_15663 [Oculimacula yallundae]|uniref:NACHT-NTPase and P-loop NTPases N-terminal domain-containing protein n=1 Tax=Oculimacula yallundae TaxID=86028 RepID=A0ABR4CHY5_9HELO
MAEFVAVLGVISSIIAIVDGVTKIVHTAKDAEGLPQTFRLAFEKLPIISDTLGVAKTTLEANKVSEVPLSVSDTIERCLNKVKDLDALLHKVMPGDKASRLKRYVEAVKAHISGKGGKVEILIKAMLEDVLLLASFKTMAMVGTDEIIRTITVMTETQRDNISKAMSEVEALPPSVADEEFPAGQYTFNNLSSGKQYVATGGKMNNFEGDAKQYAVENGNIIFNDIKANINQMPHNDKQKACLKALFLTDPQDDRENIISMKGSIVGGTCQWIKTDAAFKTWFHSDSPPEQLLWISGGPGLGKTMLAVYITQELEALSKNSSHNFFPAINTVKPSRDQGPQNILVLQYFCNDKDNKRNTAVAILRGMLYQLLTIQPTLFHHILPKFDVQKEAMFSDSSFQTLWRIFEAMVRDPSLGLVYCVLDGLDECEEASLALILQKFHTLFSITSDLSHCLRMVVVSREYPVSVARQLKPFPRICLDAEANGDIEKFIDASTNRLASEGEYPDSLRLHVKAELGRKAEGRFLWVSLVAKSLQDCENTKVKEVLAKFPPGLDQLYARMVNQIKPEHREFVAATLLWVVIAKRPLKLSELGTAVEVKAVEGFTFERVVKDKLSYCGLFLNIKSPSRSDKSAPGAHREDWFLDNDEQDVVTLVHQSASDYLLRRDPDPDTTLEYFRIKGEEGDRKVAERCFQCVQIAFKDKYSHPKNVIKMTYQSQLLAYAACYWPDHARVLICATKIFDLSLPFWQSNSSIRERWCRYVSTFHRIRYPAFYRSPSLTTLQLASFLGFMPLVLACVPTNPVRLLFFKVDEAATSGRPALSFAAAGGHAAIINILLSKGADIDVADKFGQTPLHCAAFEGHEAVVRLLVSKGAQFRASWFIWMDDSVIEALLEERPTFDTRDSFRDPLLLVAVQRTSASIAGLLLKNKAHIKAIDARDYRGRTALLIASSLGRDESVRMLLTYGVNIEARDNEGYTALMCAVLRRKEGVVHLLLEKQADIEAHDHAGNTSLLMAAQSCSQLLVRLLLEKGAKIEVKNKEGRTALDEAKALGLRVTTHMLPPETRESIRAYYRLNPEAFDSEPYTVKSRIAGWIRIQADVDAIIRLLMLASEGRYTSRMASPVSDSVS